MPLLWRYLSFDFYKITSACTLAFIAILLTMRLDEIMQFASLGASFSTIFLFILYQIPYILPIAIPLSCLIGGFILTQRLSSTHELTALRACGFSLSSIFTPIVLSAAFLSLFNFWMASEIATQSHFQTNFLKSELRAINPLHLLRNKHLMRLKGFYFEALGPSRVGESAQDVILAVPNHHQSRLHLVAARQFKIEPQTFVANGVTLIGGSGNDEKEFDHLFIENFKTSSTNVEDFSQLLQKKVWTIHNDYLKMSFLLMRIQEQKKLLGEAQQNGASLDEIKNLKKLLHRSQSEIMKRFSIGFAVVSFTLMGLALGMNISRRRRPFSLYLAIFLTAFFLITFFVAKGLEHRFWLASSLYLFPHLMILCLSFYVCYRTSKGIE